MEAVSTDVPPWYRALPRPEALGARPLTPSRPAGAEPAVRTPIGPDDRLRFRRGLVIHRLLELLPELPRERRAEACRRFLARPVHELDAAAQAEIAGETERVLDDPVFAPLFGPGSRAEVRVAGEVAGERGTMPISIRSAPAPGRPASSFSELSGSGSPAVTKVTRPPRLAAFRAAKRRAMRPESGARPAALTACFPARWRR